MPARSGSRRRGPAHEQENEERWLLTYSDMITLLMALFMLLFSISSVNISKYRTLQKALKEAFSGQILPGGKALEQNGASQSAATATPEAATTSVMPFAVESPAQATAQVFQNVPQNVPGARVAAAQREQESLQRVAQEVKAYIAAHGLGAHATVTLERRGLVITLLTDKLLFPTGSASLEPAAFPLLEDIATLVALESSQPVAIEGNTDSVPIDTPQYPSNWELSTARASTIVRFLIGHGVSAARLSAIGYAAERPIATNATVEGRAHNRRVQIVLERQTAPAEGGGPLSPAAGAQAGAASGASAQAPAVPYGTAASQPTGASATSSAGASPTSAGGSSAGAAGGSGAAESPATGSPGAGPLLPAVPSGAGG